MDCNIIIKTLWLTFILGVFIISGQDDEIVRWVSPTRGVDRIICGSEKIPCKSLGYASQGIEKAKIIVEDGLYSEKSWGQGVVGSNYTSMHFVAHNYSINGIVNVNVTSMSGGILQEDSRKLPWDNATFEGFRFFGGSFSGSPINDGAGGVSIHSNYIQFTNCIFEENSSNSIGGALFLTGTKIQITHCTFRNNYGFTSPLSPTSVNGGAAVLSASSIIIEDSHFINNSLIFSTNLKTYTGHGAALHIYDCLDLKIHKSTFSHNSAMGAQLYGTLSVTGTLNNIDISYTTFYDNHLLGFNGMIITNEIYGAGLYVEGSHASLNVLGCNFTNNEVIGGVTSTNLGGTVYGGAICTNTQKNVIQNSNFHNNSAIGGYQDFGIDVLMLGYGYGGAIAIVNVSQSNTTIILNGNQFHGNNAKSSTRYFVNSAGGAIYVKTNNFSITFLDRNSSYVNNSATQLPQTENIHSEVQGGAICFECDLCGTEASSIIIENCVFQNNIAEGVIDSTGGAISCKIPATFHIERTKFIENKAVSNNNAKGGSIFTADQSSLYIVNCNFTDNQVQAIVEGSGGTIYTDFLYVQQSIFERNKVLLIGDGGSCTGGAITTCRMIANGSTFSSNRVNSTGFLNFGGAVFLGSCNPSSQIFFEDKFDNCSFVLNAASYGGACYFNTSQKIVFTNIHMDFNTANQSGACIFVPYHSINPNLKEICKNITHGHVGLNITNIPPPLYGPTCASEPYSITFDTKPPHIVWPSEDVSLILYTIDYFDNVVIAKDIAVFVTIEPTNCITIGVPQDTLIANQTGYMSIPAIINSIQQTECNVLWYLVTNHDVKSNHTFHVSKCPPGFTLSPNPKICIMCPELEYNLKGSDCVSCPLSQTSCFHLLDSQSIQDINQTNMKIVKLYGVEEGFWASPLQNPKSILHCPNQQACLPQCCSVNYNLLSSIWTIDCTFFGSPKCNQSTCLEGYYDRMCSRCVCSTSERCWFSYGKYKCQPCSTYSLYIFVGGIFVVLFTLVLLLYFDSNTRFTRIFFVVEIIIVIMCVIFGGGWTILAFTAFQILLYIVNQEQVPRGSLKILVLFLQIESEILEDMYFPSWALVIVETTQKIIFMKLFGLECIGFHTLLGKFLFMMSLPLILCGILFIAKLIAYKLNPENRNITVKQIFLRSLGPFAFIFYAAYFEMVNTILPIISPCDNDKFSKKFPWLYCDFSNPEYTGLFLCALIFLIIYVILIPLVIAKRVFYSHEIKDDHPLEFLYENYKLDRWWFEGIFWMRQLVICSILILIPDEFSFWRSAVLIGLMIFTILIVVLLQPFKNTHHNWSNFLEILSACTIIFTILCMLLQQAEKSSSFYLITASCLATVVFFLPFLKRKKLWLRETKLEQENLILNN